MASNRVYPAYQDYDTFSDSTDWDSRRSVAFQNEKDCNCCFQRRCFCITGIVLLTLGAISAFISLGVIYGIPENKDLYTRECKTSSGKSGFLCDDRATCIGASALCDGKVDCGNGEDESRRYCGNLPNSLPEGLVYKCANSRSWTYMDKLCDNRNDCGDCSDESATRCPLCPGWRCNTVHFADCDCISKSRCHDNIQDCTDWSDEISCE
ncbi:low-density lipoprotein receptor class A domain-containing protein 1-like isoform X2 [Pseudophryne corroboree]|uniref:low-density lipoprotein receptor class A domain-containing protein 1-like isoform X2 n=1 Tax=Pseudophryne corroboree TaxID=495146 RepID=UPI003081AF26